MSMYELPKIEISNFKLPKFWKSQIFLVIILSVFVSSVTGFISGTLSGGYFYLQAKDYLAKFNIGLPGAKMQAESGLPQYQPQTSQEQMVIKVVKDASPAVVSIVITKDVPIIEEYYVNPFQGFGQLFQIQIPQYRQNGTQKQEVGGGTGFVVSEDGLVLTNKHVVLDAEAEFTVLTNDGKKYPAKVLARDPVQDLAVLKIESSPGQTFPKVTLGDSSRLEMGQTVIAIGNALGEFRNTISVGVVSGLGRTITASGGDFVETLEDIIQTDAAINKGNSGGPLLNLRGEVIGINTATVQDAQSIGFTVPINKAKRAIEQVSQTGKISYPFIGVRYVIVTDQIQKEDSLSVNYGALVLKGPQGQPAVSPGSPAEKAGLKENDIILELNGEKITADNPLKNIIEKYKPGDTVSLRVLRGKEEINVQVALTERT